MVARGLIVLSFLVCLANSAKILVIFPMYAHSHFILGSALVKGLVEKGHHVTMLSPFPQKEPKHENYTDVLTGPSQKLKEMKSDLYKWNTISPYRHMMNVYTLGIEVSDNVFRFESVQNLLKSNETFDLVLLELFFNEAHLGFSHHFNCPTVIFAATGATEWSNHVLGNPTHYAYIPSLLLHYSEKMSFFQRVYNTVFGVVGDLYRHFVYFPAQNEILRKHFKGVNSFWDILDERPPLMLALSHVSINQPVPHLPSMVEIGGFHVKKSKPLPKDLQTYIDNAKEGVIFFSMGSNLQVSKLETAKLQAILRVFSKLPQKILMKWEEDEFKGKPDNVKAEKWLPQQDVLAHPNVCLFVTHGGLLSTIESVYFGVPFLALPVFADQKMNAAHAASQGYGMGLSLGDVTEDTFSESLHEILGNPKYKENVKKRSALMHDQIVPPIDQAVYWMEHVIRHGGAAHMRGAGLDLTWYQYLLLDVVAFLIAVTVAPIIVVYVLAKKLLKKNIKIDHKKKKN